ncbi:MAG: hypothetical protein H7263_05745 [Candidatus Sericytochromatia bacterium]|nr:hypothetical protein [Candidatus Sericytochromatia bacterium]
MEKEIVGIEHFIKKRQYLIAEKNAKILLKKLNPKNKEQYEIYVKLILLISESLEKSIKNLNALEELEKAYILFPWEDRILYQIYSLCSKLKRSSRVESSLKELISLRTDDISFRIELAKFYVNKKENILAIMEVKKILDLGIYDLSIYRYLISLLKESNQYIELLKNIKLLQNLDPENASLIIEESGCLVSLGDPEQALELINGLLDYKSESNLIDFEYINAMITFFDVYIKFDYRERLIKFYIKILIKDYNTFNKEVKSMIDNLTNNLKLELLFNLVLKKPYFDIKKLNISEYNIIENIILIEKSKQDLLITDSEIKNLLDYLELDKLISREFIFYCTSFLN